MGCVCGGKIKDHGRKAYGDGNEANFGHCVKCSRQYIWDIVLGVTLKKTKVTS